jgi:hypothetical protein
VVRKLDRLARSIRQLIETAEEVARRLRMGAATLDRYLLGGRRALAEDGGT